MRLGILTAHETEIIHRLLTKHNIARYEVVGAVGEGKALQGSTGPGDVESLSGTIVTTTKAYSFWLDWSEDGYTLGEKNGQWRELSTDAMKDYEIVEAQERLRKQ